MVRHQQQVSTQTRDRLAWLVDAGLCPRDQLGLLRLLDVACQQHGLATIGNAQRATQGIGFAHVSVVTGLRVQHLEVDTVPLPALPRRAARDRPQGLQRMV